MSGILFGTPGTQSPKAYDLANLSAGQLATRLQNGTSAAVVAALRAAQADVGYRFAIHPAETAAGLTAADLSWGYDPFNAFRYLTAAQRTDVINRTLTLDCTANLQKWLNASAGTRALIPAGSYLIGSTAGNPGLVAKSGTYVEGSARGEVILSYPGSGPITNAMLWFSEGVGSIVSAFACKNIQFQCTNIVATNTSILLRASNPVYFQIENVVCGGANATANALIGIQLDQDAGTYTPPLGAGTLRHIECVVEPPGAAIAGSIAVNLVGFNSEALENIMMDGEGAIEHFHVGVQMKYVQNSVLQNWEFRGASGLAGDVCIQLIGSNYNTIIAPTLAPAPTYGTGISLDAASTYNATLSPGWNLSSGSPLAAYTDAGVNNSILVPGNASQFTPVAQCIGAMLLKKLIAAQHNLEIQRLTTDTGSGLQVHADHVPANNAFLLIDRGSGVAGQDLEWIGANGTVFDRVDQTGQRYLTSPNAAPASANLANSQFTVWLDEAGNNIKFLCKLSNGTVKTGTLAIA